MEFRSPPAEVSIANKFEQRTFINGHFEGQQKRAFHKEHSLPCSQSVRLVESIAGLPRIYRICTSARINFARATLLFESCLPRTFLADFPADDLHGPTNLHSTRPSTCRIPINANENAVTRRHVCTPERATCAYNSCGDKKIQTLYTQQQALRIYNFHYHFSIHCAKILKHK